MNHISISLEILLCVLGICSSTITCPPEAESCEFNTNRGGRDIQKAVRLGTFQECYDLCVTIPRCVAAVFNEGLGKCYVKHGLTGAYTHNGYHVSKIGGCSVPDPPHGAYKIINATTPYLQLQCKTGFMIRGRLNGTTNCGRNVGISQRTAFCQKIHQRGHDEMSGYKGKTVDMAVHVSMESLAASTQPDCAWKCAEERRCQWFTYDRTAQGCQLFNEPFAETSLINDENAEVYWFPHD